MFYSTIILTKKGTLGQIWIAAHWENKLTKKQIKDILISKSVHDIESPPVALSLRLTAHLLLGIVRIFKKKVNYLKIECEESTARIFTSLNPSSTINDEDLVTARNEDLNLHKFMEDTLELDISLDMDQELRNWKDLDEDPKILENLLNMTHLEYTSSFHEESIEEPRGNSSILNLSDSHQIDEYYPPSKFDNNEEHPTLTTNSILPPFPEDLDLEIQRNASSRIQEEAIDPFNTSLDQHATTDFNSTHLDFFDVPDFIENTSQVQNPIEIQKDKKERKKRKRIYEDSKYPEKLYKKRQIKYNMETKERIQIQNQDPTPFSYQNLNSFSHFSTIIQQFIQEQILSNTFQNPNNSFPIDSLNNFDLPDWNDGGNISYPNHLNSTLLNNSIPHSPSLNSENSIIRQSEQIEEFKNFVHQKIVENNQQPIQWTQITLKTTKKVAARNFFSLLMLKSENVLDVQQSSPYSEILISEVY